ncbi:hypothetical protein AKJ39_04370, partial [candidate division MSBL1 archaeon SCGC-AAA259J03]
MTAEVITAAPDESITSVTGKMEKHNISAVPVIEKSGKILGIITSDLISRLVKRGGLSNSNDQEI